MGEDKPTHKNMWKRKKKNKNVTEKFWNKSCF